MKIRVTYKSPDALHEAAYEAVRNQADQYGLTSSEWLDAAQKYVEDLYSAGLGEYITLEVDTVTKAVTFVKKGT